MAKKQNNKLTAAELFKMILASGVTIDDFLAEAHKNGIDLKFGVTPIEEDPINQPYYQDGGIETIDVIEAKSTPEEFEGYCKCTAQVYLLRAGKKAGVSAEQDKQKAIWYLNRSMNLTQSK